MTKTINARGNDIKNKLTFSKGFLILLKSGLKWLYFTAVCRENCSSENIKPPTKTKR